MSFNDKMPFTEGYALLKAEGEAGRSAPGRPKKIRRSEIRMAHSVFQPRMFEGTLANNEAHIIALKEAITNAEDHQLDPITVWWSGKHWRPLDGHHRLIAYQRLAEDKKRPLVVEEIKSTVFNGTLDEAVTEAVKLNSKNKLPMSRDDKIERAWKLVAIKANLSRVDIVKATGVSERTVANMRSTLKEIEAEGEEQGTPLPDLLWRDVVRGRREAPDHDEQWQERMARDWARRLAKTFGEKPTKMPSIFVRAMELYSEQLAASVREHCRDMDDTTF